jgi:hypothetical protein
MSERALTNQWEGRTSPDLDLSSSCCWTMRSIARGRCRADGSSGSLKPAASGEQPSEPAPNISRTFGAFGDSAKLRLALEMTDFARRCRMIKRPLTAETRVRIPVAVSTKTVPLRQIVATTVANWWPNLQRCRNSALQIRPSTDRLTAQGIRCFGRLVSA